MEKSLTGEHGVSRGEITFLVQEQTGKHDTEQ